LLSSIKRFPPEKEASWDCELSVVECALGWSEGLSTLCNAGYRTDFAFEVAIFRNDVPSAKLMMGSDILITEHHLQRVSNIHNSRLTDLHKDVLEWTVDTLFTRRTELRKLAIAKLPASFLEDLRLDMSRPPDSISSRLVEELEGIGITVPPPLHPTSAPLFHSFDISSGAAGRLARLLVRAGFDEIDSLDRYGKTPLDEAFRRLFTVRSRHWSIDTCNRIVWMIRHGACVNRDLGIAATSVRPLFALACLYSTNYNEGRRWTQWHWENDEEFQEMLETLKTAANPNPLDNTELRHLMLDLLGLESDWSETGSSSVSDAGSYVSRGGSAPTIVGGFNNRRPSSTSGSLPDNDEEESESDEEALKSDEWHGPRFSARQSRFKRPPRDLIFEVARRDPNIEDDCECYCSTSGCLPIHMISVLGGFDTIKTWPQIQDDIFDWIDDCGASPDQTRKYMAGACRLEVFSRLGMAHTCCRMNTSFRCANLSEEARMELQEEDTELNTQLELIMAAFDAVLAHQKHQLAESIWELWWRKLDTILQPLLPWERGLQYCDMSPKDTVLSRLLQLRELRHGVALKRMGYADDVGFLEVIKDHIPALLGVCLEEQNAVPLRVFVGVEDRVGSWKGRDVCLVRRRVKRRRSF
jgi:hypothetical protein